MPRVIVLVLDSFGVGASIDASDYGDAQADTLGHIAQYCARPKEKGGRGQPLAIPHLRQLGLGFVATASTGKIHPGLEPIDSVIGSYGYAVEKSVGKDTPSGHWEMMGVPVFEQWHLFPDKVASLDDRLINRICQESNLPGVLGNCHASGTEIIQRFGSASIQTGKPILYTSGDSVIQFAAHETHFGLEKLYQLCQQTRKLADELNVARVIARPFVDADGQYRRTPNRRDFSTPPPARTLLDHCQTKGIPVTAIGKIRDIFAGQGVDHYIPAKDNMDLFDATLKCLKGAPTPSFIFTNFVDFDSLYGHRRDIAGYAEALEAFDARLPELYAQLAPEDLLLLTADHGCDPSFPGSDHTREHIPILVYGPSLGSQYFARRESFADIGQTLATYLNVEPLNYGVSFLPQCLKPSSK